ncbi:MAG: diguanylate cyclase domain-containing protein [Spirulinaceae cyanobacterium]
MSSTLNLESSRPIEYLVCNQDLVITDYSYGITELLLGAIRLPLSCQVDKDVRTCLPELVGLETVIREIFEQQRSTFELLGIQQTQNNFVDISLRSFPPDPCPLEQKSLMVFVKDASERMQLEQRFSQVAKEHDLALQELSATKNYLHQLLAHMNDALLVTDAGGQIRQANPASLQLFQYEYSELLGMTLSMLVKSSEKEDVIKGISGDDYELDCMTRAGEEITVSFSCSPITDQITGEQEFLYIGRDISQRKQAERELSELANKDGLTRLANRYFFDQTLQELYHESISNARPLSLLLCDVDFFKHYNDYYGHLQGDECLRKVGKALLELTQGNGYFAARYGGEEFALLLPDTSHDVLPSIADQIRESLKQYALPHPYSPVAKIVTISIGGATFHLTEQLKKPIELIQQADQALYRAKDLGRNCYCSYDSECGNTP